MNKKTTVALLTAAGFAIGLGAGLWIGFNRVPATPPPDWLFTEFKSTTKPGSSLQNIVQSRPDLWKEINGELISLRGQIDEFKERLKEIDDDFRRDFEAVLSEPQRRKLAELQLRRELPRIHVSFTPKPDAGAAPAASGTPTPPAPAAPAAPSEKPPRMYQESTNGLVAAMIFVPYTKERFTLALQLDAEQQTRLRELLLLRRERFLKLSDDTPPPSLQMRHIADIIRRAEAAETASGQPAK